MPYPYEGTVAIITKSESWHCKTFPQREIEQTVQDTSLGRLYWLWRTKGGNEVPRSAAFDPMEILSDHEMSNVHYVTVDAPNPMDFMFRAPEISHAAWPTVAAHEMASDIRRRELLSDLLVCRQKRIAILQRINHIVSLAVFDYMQLMLPVENADGVVDGIYLGYRELKAADIKTVSGVLC